MDDEEKIIMAGMEITRNVLLEMKDSLRYKLSPELWEMVDLYATTSFIAGKIDATVKLIERHKNGKM